MCNVFCTQRKSFCSKLVRSAVIGQALNQSLRYSGGIGPAAGSWQFKQTDDTKLECYIQGLLSVLSNKDSPSIEILEEGRVISASDLSPSWINSKIKTFNYPDL